MLVKINCPGIRKIHSPGVRCNRFLGEVEGHYVFKCDRCKAVIEGDTKAGWVKIVHPSQK